MVPTPFRADALALLALASWVGLCAALVGPWPDVPILDDWTYAWSVERLLQTGELAILPISSVYPVAQVLWGALFCLPFGFSFNALRVSTLVIAVLGAWAFYATLRELGSGQRRALFGTFLVLANPLTILLMHSFMTDIPFLSVTCAATWLFTRGILRRHAGSLWCAGALAVTSVLIRQVGVALPVAAAGVALFMRDPWLRRTGRAQALATFAAAFAAWAVVSWLVGQSADEARRLDRLRHLASPGWTGYGGWLIHIVLGVSFMLFPLGLSSLAAQRPKLSAALALGAAALALGGLPRTTPFDPIALHHAILTPLELGSARDLLRGELAAPAYAGMLSSLAAAIALASLAALFVSVALARHAPPPRPHAPARAYLAAQAACHVALICVLWLFCDRYYLVLLPIAVAAVLPRLRSVPLSIPVAALGLLAQAAVGILGTRDALRFNAACQSEYAALVRSGIQPYDIDAGWSLNGWMLYAHPQRLPASADRARDVPFVTSEQRRPYVLAKAPIGGYRVLKHEQWDGPVWPAQRELFVLQMEAR